MGVFTHWPYTNLHELNLDFILQELKKAIEEWTRAEQEFINLEDAVASLKKYVDTYFKNLNVSEEINSKLEDMLASGELDSVFEAVLARQKGSYIAINRIFNESQVTDRYEDAPSKYWVINGSASDGNTLVIAYTSSKNGNNNYVTMRKYDTNFNIVQEKLVEVNHCNDMCYYDGKLYCTGYDGGNPADTLKIVDYETLTVLETKYLGNPFMCIGYYDGYFYTSQGADLIKYDLEFNVVESMILETPQGVRSPAKYGLEIHEGNIYLGMGFPNSIECYTLAGQLINVYNIGYQSGDYPIVEAESLCYFDNQFMLLSTGYPGWNSENIYNQIFTIDFKHGTNNGLYTPHPNINGTVNLYVDANSTSKNPDGTQARPYTEINVAVLHALTYKTPLIIYVAAGEYSYVSFVQGPTNTIWIRGNGTRANIKVRGCNFGFAGNVYLSNVTILDNLGQRNGAIYGSDSHLTIMDCNFETTQLAIWYERGTVILRSLNFINESTNEPIRVDNSILHLANAPTRADTSKTLIYANRSLVSAPNNTPISKASGDGLYSEIVYNITPSTGAVTVPTWLSTLLQSNNYNEWGIIVKSPRDNTAIFTTKAGERFVSGSLIEYGEWNKLYTIRFDRNSLNVSGDHNGYVDLTSPTTINQTAKLSILGIVIR